MCLITYAPKGAKTLDHGTLIHSYNQMNDDGFGLAWFNDSTGMWVPWRSMRSHRLLAALRKIPSDAPMVVHQRYATHGSKTMANVHPFPIGDTGALLFHNGTISGTRADSARYSKTSTFDMSDTRSYIQDELAPILEVTGTSILTDDRVTDAIGSRVRGSVLTIVIPGDPMPVMINEHQGDWEGDLYYSNSYSRPSKYVSKYDGMYGHNFSSDDEYWESEYDRYYDRHKVNNGSRLIGYRGPDSEEDPKRAAAALDGAEALCDLHFEKDNRPYEDDDDSYAAKCDRFARLTPDEQEWAEWFAEQDDIDDETRDYLEAQYGLPVKRKAA